MPAASTPRQIDRWSVLAGLITIAAFALAARPYLGIWHDGSLYFGQVLRHSRVPELAHDIFFASGSQDRFSIYSQLVMPLYGLLGEGVTHMAVVLACWLCTGSAVFALLTLLDQNRSTALWGLMAFAVISPMYGGGWAFSYSEQFLTARSAAEPLLVWALVAMLRGQYKLLVTLLISAALIHPLMTLPVLAALYVYLARQDRRWLWLLAAFALPLIAGTADLPPWGNLFKRYDAYWWSLFDTASPQVLLQNWSVLDWSGVALDAGVLLGAAYLSPSARFSRLLSATAGAMVLLLVLALVLVDGLHGVLPTQLQLWRVHWIAHLLAVATSPWLALQLWKRGGLWRASACALALAIVNVHVGGLHGPATCMLLALTTALAWKLPAGSVSRTTTLLVCLVVMAVLLMLSAARLNDLLLLLQWRFPTSGWSTPAQTVLSFPVMALPCFGALLWLSRMGQVGRWGAVCLSTALLALAIQAWDQRSDLARAVESPRAAPHQFQAHLPPGASVYWPDQLAAVWGLLERSSHFAPQQGSGMLFNRGNAMAFGERREQYRAIARDRSACTMAASLTRDRQGLVACDTPSSAALVELCRTADPPTAIVLPGLLKPAPLATWQPPAERDSPQTFALYSCQQLAALQP